MSEEPILPHDETRLRAWMSRVESQLISVNALAIDNAERIALLENQPGPPPDGIPAAMRGLWIQAWADPAQSVRNAANVGANTIFVFVGNGRAVSVHNTHGIPLPNGEYFSQTVNEAARQGIDVYACIAGRHFTRQDYPEQDLLNRVDGVDRHWLDFRNAGARALLVGLAVDIVREYGVNLILDYFRYHQPWYRESGVLEASDVTLAVGQVFDAVSDRAIVAASPVGPLNDSEWSAYEKGQEWDAWLDARLVHWASPMSYHDLPALRERVREWTATGHYPSMLCPVLSFLRYQSGGPYVKTVDDFRSEIRYAYDSGVLGLCVFDETDMAQVPQLADVLRDEWQ